MQAIRNGNFTSSEIVALTTNGKTKGTLGDPYYTYIQECNMERELSRAIETEVDARATSWGTLVEPLPFRMLPLDYKLCSQETLSHPTISCWKGSPDMQKFDDGGTACDIKCPHTLKSFCQLVRPMYQGLTGTELMNAIRFGYTDKAGVFHKKHQQGEKFYWQIVSNAILLKAKYGELIVFAPYQSQLELIRSMAEGNPKYYWIWSSSDEELPFLIEGGFYKNLNILRFEIPLQDKLFLHDRVEMASKLLVEPKILQVA
jgi:hypothetical protein